MKAEDEELLQKVIAGLTTIDQKKYKNFRRELERFVDKRIRVRNDKNGCMTVNVYEFIEKDQEESKVISLKTKQSHGQK